MFENFLASRFTTVKRYGGDGCQALIALFHQMLRESVSGKKVILSNDERVITYYMLVITNVTGNWFIVGGVERMVVCMAHRGRLNLQTTVLNLPPIEMFQKVRVERLLLDYIL